MVHLCSHELLATQIESSFNYLTNAEQWSIAPQFLSINLYCVTQTKMSLNLNWGTLLDNSLKLSDSLAAVMPQAQHNNQSPEEQLLNWINAQSNLFGLNTPLSLENIEAIKKDFATRYVQIKRLTAF